MKRIVSAIVATLALVVSAAPSQAAGITAVRTRNFYATQSSPYGSLWMTFFQVTDLTGQQPETVTGCVDVRIGPAQDSGCGPMTVTFDPLNQAGTITATVQGAAGPIVADLTYLTTRAGSNLPYADAEVVPTPPQSATVFTEVSRNGRANGTITTAFGPMGVVNASAGIVDSIIVSATI
ncbi:MAG TPA: hypothetical protein VGB64_04255 [Actinomycetota bacterium]